MWKQVPKRKNEKCFRCKTVRVYLNEKLYNWLNSDLFNVNKEIIYQLLIQVSSLGSIIFTGS